MFIECDAYHDVNGIIVDKTFKTPLDSVAIGQGEKDDGNPFYKRIYSNNKGMFHYTGINGSNELELYFTKTGYKTIKIEYNSRSRPDTIYLEKANK